MDIKAFEKTRIRFEQFLQEIKVKDYEWHGTDKFFFLPEEDLYIFLDEDNHYYKILRNEHVKKLIVLGNNGHLTQNFFPGWEALITCCGDCKKTYFTAHCSKFTDKCPKCGSRRILPLTSNGHIISWTNDDPQPIISDEKIEELIKHLDSTGTDSIRSALKKLSGIPKYIYVTEYLRKQVEGLKQTYPNMEEVIDYILTTMRTSEFRKNRDVAFKPILLVGNPACGKTSFTTELCKILMNKPAIKIDLGNEIANLTLSGTDFSFNKAKHGLIVQSMFADKDGQPLKNPVIHFDELDKINTREEHTAEPVFYSILEKNTARNFYDNFLGTNVDASGINYIFTANSTENIPAPILSRLRIFKIDDYTHQQMKDSILDNFYHNWIENNGMQKEYLPAVLSDEIKEKILAESNDDPRSLSDAISTVFVNTLVHDSETDHDIALFSPAELYNGWQNYRGQISLPSTSWTLPKKHRQLLSPDPEPITIPDTFDIS